MAWQLYQGFQSPISGSQTPPNLKFVPAAPKFQSPISGSQTCGER